MAEINNEISDLNLYDLIDEFDSSEPILNGFSNNNLENVSNNNSYVPSKIKTFNRILKKVETGLNNKLKRTNLSVSNFNFRNTFSADEISREATTKISYNKNQSGKSSNVLLNLNVNVKKLLNYPAMEVYAIVSALAYNSVLGGVDGKNLNNVKFTEGNESGKNDAMLQTAEDITQARSEEVQLASAKFLIREYLRDFLPNYFGDTLNTDLDFISSMVADQLVSQMNEREIANVSSFFFKFDKLDRAAAKEGKKYFASGNLFRYRTARVQENASKYTLDGVDADYYKNAKALGSQQQFLALSSTFAGKNDKVKQALAGGFDNSNKKLAAFCQEYADSFMDSNKLKSIEIRFVNEGNCQFVDDGKSHYININLSAPELEGGSITELVMTLSHELTHAVDASLGEGMTHSMDEDISNIDFPEAENLINRLQSYCYQLDPNERHGRLGEISALKFLNSIYAGDSDMQEQIQNSVNKYSSYQMQTITAAENLPDEIAKFESRFEELKAKGLSRGMRAYDLIEKRIKYLKEDILPNLNTKAERNSIEDAYEAAGKTIKTTKTPEKSSGMEME